MRVLLVIYDNDAYIHWFPLGQAYIAAALRDAGHEVVIYSQDAYHYPDEHLTAYLSEHRFDVVGIGVVGGYYQYHKLLRLTEAIHQVPNRPRLVLGGHGPSPVPEYFLTKTGADVAVLGEGEVTIVDLLDAWATGRDLAQVPGICYRADSDFVRTPARPLVQNIDALATPAWDLFPMDYYALLRLAHCENHDRVFPVIAGRGCPYQCNFCYRMEKGMRLRSPAAVVAEIRLLQERYGATYIAFMDDLLMCSARRTRELCEAFLETNLNIKWSGCGRLNIVRPELLKLMKQAGCVLLNFGIESLDDRMLKVMKKSLTTKQIIRGIEDTIAAGISPGFNIIFGNIGETQESLQRGVEFLLKYDDQAQVRTIRPVTPYPGSPLYDYAVEQGLLSGPEDFYERRHVNSDLPSVNFTPLSDEEVHTALFDANRRLLENYHRRQLERQLSSARKLYGERDAAFRGFRQT